MPNPPGINGHPTQPVVPDEELRGFLIGLSFERGGAGASVEHQRAALKEKFGLDIGRTKFFELRKKLGIPSVRRNPKNKAEQLEGLVETLEDNPSGSWGVMQTRARLAKKGILTTRATIRQYNEQNHPERIAFRMSTSLAKTPRKPLNLLGPYHQVHWDGHEKLNSQALQIGDDIGLPIYAGRCGWSGLLVVIRVVPNARCSKTIGHLFLDWIESNGYFIPLINFTDKGTEVSEMMDIQTRLRQLGEPDVDATTFPPCMQVRSVHNTPIEGFWRWLRQSDGLSLKEEILAGKDHFNLLNPYHKPLFFWIWVPLIQSILDKQREYWNSRAPRSQSNKIAPTGPSPNMLIELPHLYDADAVDCSIKVQPEWVQQERERLGGMTERDRLFKWVPDVLRG